MIPRPRSHELNVAEVLADHFRVDIEFVPTTERNTPDFLIDGVFWELKSPQGRGKNNIQRQLQHAKDQSVNVIIDASRSKKHPSKIKREVEYQFRLVKSVKRLLFISKNRKVVEIKR